MLSYENLERYLTELTIPEANARAGWFIDGWAVLEAKDELGIKLPIHFRYTTSKSHHGHHRIQYNKHKILLDQNSSAKSANFTLWHELAHCLQAEAWAKKFNRPIYLFYSKAYKLQGTSGMRYKNNKFEIHANQLAKRKENIQLVKEYKGAS